MEVFVPFFHEKKENKLRKIKRQKRNLNMRETIREKVCALSVIVYRIE